MSTSIPFVFNLDVPPPLGHDIFPNSIYRRAHPLLHDHHHHLGVDTLGLVSRLISHPLVAAAAVAKAAELTGMDAQPSAGPNQAGDYEIKLSVVHFQPEELSVKVANRCVIVEAKHEERADESGFVSRNFVRRYVLPKDYDEDAIISTLSSDGVLKICVPKKRAPDAEQERVVRIELVGPSKAADSHLSNGGKQLKRTDEVENQE